VAKIDIAVASGADIPTIRRLLEEYAAALGVDLSFQQFDRELAALPGAYAPPGGTLLVARRGGSAIGCVALRGLDAQTCELKRLFVRPSERGGGTGRALTESALAEARRIGYRRVLLDTLPGMEAAQRLYVELGFRDVPPYTENPVDGARFLELHL
jgi:N-acetylglutamate synthase-like GNAT family acetyltransferase